MSIFRRSILLLTALAIPFSVSALSLDLGGSDTQEEASIPMPDPLGLDPGWWSYFSAKGVDLGKNIQDFSKRLDELARSVPKERQMEADALIKRIKANLEALLASKNGAPPPPSPRLIQEKYDLPALLEVAQQWRQTWRDLERQKTEIAQKKQVTRSTSGLIDNLFSVYKAVDFAGVEKLLVGLEIIAERSTLTLLDKKLHMDDLRFEERETQLEYLQTERQVAKNRFDYSSLDLEALERDRIQVIEEHKTLKSKRLEEQAALASMLPQSDLEKNQLSLGTQQMTTLLAQENTLQANALTIWAAQLLYHLHHQSAPENDLSTAFNTWQATFNSLQQQLTRLGTLTKQESDRLDKHFKSSDGTNQTVAEAAESLYRRRAVAVANTLIALGTLEDSLFKAEVVAAMAKDKRVTVQPYWYRPLALFSSKFQEFWVTAAFLMNRTLFRLSEVPVNLWGIAKSILILILAWLLSRSFAMLADRMTYGKKAAALSNIYTLKRLIHYGTLGFGVAFALGLLGFSFRNLAIILGALSVGIGFGLQNLVNNFLCGIVILFEKSIKVGDLIELDPDLWGEVKEIKAQTTVVHTFRGIDVILPNSHLVTSRLINWTRKNPFQRLHIPFAVAYGTDPEVLEKVILEAAANVPITLFKGEGVQAPQLWFVGFGDSALQFELVVWIDLRKGSSRSSLKSVYNWAIHATLRENNIAIPFPQRDLHVKSCASHLFAPQTPCNGPANGQRSS